MSGTKFLTAHAHTILYIFPISAVAMPLVVNS